MGSFDARHIQLFNKPRYKVFFASVIFKNLPFWELPSFKMYSKKTTLAP